MNDDVVRVARTDSARTERAPRAALVLPPLIVDAGPAAVEKFLEFFAARIANRRTRAAYGRAVGQFLAWCEARGLALAAVAPLHVAAYIRTHPGSAPTVKQHLAALRMLGDWLVVSQVLPVNPAAAVRGPKHVVTTGATPVRAPAEARRSSRRSGCGGRTTSGRSARGGSGSTRRAARGTTSRPTIGRPRRSTTTSRRPGATSRRLTGRALSRRLVLAMIKRRAAAADLPPSTCCHTFRATGITAYLSNGGTLEHAQQIAGHASPKTTKLYDRTADTITVDEIERIVI